MNKKTYIVIIGFDEIVVNKYLCIINEAIKTGIINGYSIIDLKKEQKNVGKRIKKAEVKPNKAYYLSDPMMISEEIAIKEFDKIINDIRQENKQIKIYIATELKYHERYLKYCVENGISCLVEKPVFLPVKDGKFAPEEFERKMMDYVKKAKKNKCDVSVMTLSRYHSIYTDVVYKMIKEKMLKYNAPITSLHIRHAGGVWNLHKEFLSREDHPYKYGYGMLMHGAYHYVDMLAQYLMLNKSIYPEKQFEIAITSYAAYPKDQNYRISKVVSEKLKDNCPDWWKKEGKDIDFGETDITSTYCLREKNTKRVLTLGTISLEQTTPSVRTWIDIPEGLYNKNGRTSDVNLEIQLSTLFAASVKCYKVPNNDGKPVERLPIKPHIITRANAALLPDEEYETKKIYPEVYNSDSNKTILLKWIQGKENRSTLEQHLPVVKLMGAIGMSLKKQGESVVIDF